MKISYNIEIRFSILQQTVTERYCRARACHHSIFFVRILFFHPRQDSSNKDDDNALSRPSNNAPS